MKNFLTRQAFLWSLLTNGILYALAYFCFYPQYGTIDDPEMQLVASGVSLSPVPSPNLRWTHIFVGYLLSQLYTQQPDLPWYGLYLYTAHFIGTTALLYVVFKMEMSWLRWLAGLVVLVGFQYPVLQELQYTSASVTLGLGGTLLLFLAFFRSDSRWSPIWYIFAYVFICLSAMMRWHSLLLVAILSAPFLFYVIFQQGGRWWLRSLLVLLPLGASFGLQQAHLQIQSQHAGWNDFEKRMARGLGHDIMDYHIERYNWDSTTMPIYWSNGWSYNDYQLFTHWFMADSTVFGTQKQDAIKTKFEELYPKYDTERIEKRLQAFVQEQPLPDYLYYAFLFAFWALMMMAAQRSTYATVLLTAGGAYALCALLSVMYHLPERVSYSIGYSVAAVALLWVGYQNQNTISRTLQWGSVLLLGFLLVMPTLKTTWQKSKKVYSEYTRYALAFKDLNPQPDQIYAMAPSLFQRHLVLPLGMGDSTVSLRNFKAVDFGNLSNMPTYYEQLDALKVQKDIHKHLIDNPKGFLIYRPGRPHWDWYMQYINEHQLDTMRYKQYKIYPELDIVIQQMTRDTMEW